MSYNEAPLRELLGGKGYIRGPFGSALKRNELKEEGVPVYEQQHAIRGVREFRYFIDDEKYEKLKRFTVEVDDLIISCSGTVGRISVIREGDPKGIISQALLILRPDAKKVLPEYLFYFFASKRGFKELINASQGAVQLNIAPRAVVEKIPVPLPSIDKQKEIINKLKTLDDKIRLNRQTNQTLEQIAQATFKSWFVDFEPVKAKIHAKQKGEDPERTAMCAISGKLLEELEQLSVETQQQLKNIAALFPDTLVDSEIGEIPEGWKIQKIEDIIELAYGKALKKTARIDGEFPVYGSGGLTGTHNELLVEGPGIIVGRKGTVGSLYWEDNSFFPIDTVFYVKCKSGMTLPFLFYLFQTLGLENMNTDAAVPGLNRNNVYRLKLPMFPVKLINEYTSIASEIRDKIKSVNHEISALESIRDCLLPKLLSGELEINSSVEA